MKLLVAMAMAASGSGGRDARSQVVEDVLFDKL